VILRITLDVNRKCIKLLAVSATAELLVTYFTLFFPYGYDTDFTVRNKIRKLILRTVALCGEVYDEKDLRKRCVSSLQ